MHTVTWLAHRGGRTALTLLVLLSLLVSLLPAAVVEAAAPSTLHTTAATTVTNAAEFVTPLIDASNYESLHVSFDFDASALDANPAPDTFTYGWRAGAVDTELGTFSGLAGEVDPLEIDTISDSLPVGAQVANLQIYISVTANTGSDAVEITNLVVTGEELPEPVVVCAPQTDVAGPTDIENSTSGEYFLSIADALLDCDTADGDTITLLADLTTTEQITINRPITLDGNGFTIAPTFTKTSNSNNAVISILADDVTLDDVTIDGEAGTDLHGINVYEATGVSINDTTVDSPKRTALVVNGSDVTVSNFTTSGSEWHAINAAPGSGVTAPTVLTVNGISTHAEAAPTPHIYTDDISKDVTVIDTNEQYEIVYEGANPANPTLTARSYRLKLPTATVTLCKVDNFNEPLNGWRLALLGEEVASLDVVPNGATQSTAALPAGAYVVEATGTYVYRTGPDMPADAAFSLRRDTETTIAGPFQNGLWLPSTYWGAASYLSLQVNGLPHFFGATFSPLHTYYAAIETATAAPLDFRMVDTSTGDNSGEIAVRVYTGFAADTVTDGCVELVDVPYGTYTVAEQQQLNWTPLSGLGELVVDEPEVSVTVKNKDLSLVATVAITAPAVDGDEVTGASYEFTATFTDDDPKKDVIRWAVRAGTCAAGTNTIAGNVDGFNNPSSFEDGAFTTTLAIDTWVPGTYCLVVNPQEQAGEPDVRATRQFVVPVSNKPIITAPTAEQVFLVAPIVNAWTMATGTTFVPVSYQIAYNYDDGHAFGGVNTCVGQVFAGYTGFVGCRDVLTTSRNHAPTLAEQGGVTIWVRALDAESNYSDWSDPVHYYYEVPDTTAPAVPTGLAWTDADDDAVPNGGTTDLMSGTASWNQNTEADFSHYIYKYWNDIETSPYRDEATAWTVSRAGITTTNQPGSFNQGEGVHYFCIAAVDTTGNMSACSAPFMITYDVPTGGDDTPTPDTLLVALEACKYIAEVPEAGWEMLFTNGSEVLSATTTETGCVEVVVDILDGPWEVLEAAVAGYVQSAVEVSDVTGQVATSSASSAAYPQMCTFALPPLMMVTDPGEDVPLLEDMSKKLALPDFNCTFFNSVVEGEDDVLPPVVVEDDSNDSNGRSAQRLVTTSAPVGQVLGASTTTAPVCGMYLRDYLRMAATNDAWEVMKLQAFLTAQGYFTPMTGTFDAVTDANVRLFQEKYRAEVLAPWGSIDPTGYVFQTTRWKINNLVCPGSEAMPVLQ